MPQKTLCALAAALMLLSGAALADDDWGTAPPARPAAAAPLKFTRLSVRDPGIDNIEAVSLLIPAGWKVEGGVQWYPDYSILASLVMRVSDPQTAVAIEFLPLQNFTWLDRPIFPMQPGTNYLGNVVWQPIRSAPEFVQTFYAPQSLRHLAGARVVATEDFPKVAEEVARANGGRIEARATRVRYEFAGPGGRPWEEDVYVTLAYVPYDGGTLWSVSSAYSFRAPKGQLDRMTPILHTSIETLRIGRDWYCGYMYVQQLFMKRMNDSIRNARAISDTITKNSEEIRRMFSESYRESCASQDRIGQSWSEYIRGVDTYKNPFEDRPVELPSGYRHAWVNSRGDCVLSNDAGYDPNVGDTIEWRRMERRGER
jgi:hypothetical protein